ncbi:AfsR/SARP family transcriptional regulator [Streptomyces cavernae]|uniref:AfsR/SARP family transcriptional regulator n=1 Tax=Streptomyces cavernae TaxID=2259034 RepID=UPI00192E4BCF|nr:BTAD domain-containing putative transcriptional regulator [Streptomyces cavernae]
MVAFGVLGPVVAERDGVGLVLKGPRHRAVLARLIVARRRVVPVARLVDDLWEDPPAGAVGAVQTFVGALRRALEPERPPRAPARLLVTDGPGYVLRAEPDAVDAWRFETAVAEAAGLPAEAALQRLDRALGMWRGPAYAEFADEDWPRAERSRLAELRLQAVEGRASARLALGLAAAAVPDLEAHLTEHPWREEAWRLLALALYRTDRQADALAVLRRARTALTDGLGLDPGPRLRRLETAILRQDPDLDPGPPSEPAPPGRTPRPTGKPRPTGPGSATTRLWTEATAAYDHTVAAGSRARIEATVGLIRNLAVTGGGGLEAARVHRMEAITVAEESGDTELVARVIGAYDVPAIWTRSDDPELARRIVNAAERALAALPGDPSCDAARCRLLATVALEMRGTRAARGPQAARAAEGIARRLDDPALLAFALNGRFMQSCTRAGRAAERDAIGAELIGLAARHDLVTYEVLGHLIRMQARGALDDFSTADTHAAAADRLAERHELPLVGVFTEWYGALRLAAAGRRECAGAAYRTAAARLDGAGMPGLSQGLLPLALLSLDLACDGEPGDAAEPGDAMEPGGAPEPGTAKETAKAAETEEATARAEADWGPYRPWAEPLLLLRSGRGTAAREALAAVPEAPADLLYEALTCLEASAAVRLGERGALERARARLAPAAGEIGGAGSGLLTVGPVTRHLRAVEAALAAG